MSEYINVEESYVKTLLENAAWDAASVDLHERGSKKGDEGAGKDKKDKPDFTTDARKGDKSKTKKGKKDFEGDDFEGCESVEAHTCPLCESELEEALTDEQIQEHVYHIQAALECIEEEEDIDEDGAVTVGAGVMKTGEDDEDSGAPKSRKDKVTAKVKALKAAAKS